MPLKTHDSLVQSEEAHKERIYQNLEAIRSGAHQAENRRRNYVNSGAYEDQAAFMAYADLSSAREKFNAADQLYRILYRKPYFAHIEILENGESKVKHCFLSDCELLDQPVFVEDRQVKGVLLPFKQSAMDLSRGKITFCVYRGVSEKGALNQALAVGHLK